jgi:NAD+ synthase
MEFNPKEEAKRIVQFIRDNTSAFAGGVVGLSGGVDSSTCAKLMVDAIGKENVLGISIPAKDSNPNDLLDAKRVAEWLGIRFKIHPLTPLLDHFGVYEYIKDRNVEEIKKKYYIKPETPMPRRIAYPCVMKLRGRMYIITHYAFINDYFACQTLNKTEWLVGMFDKFGDACGDIAPIWH